MIHPAYRNYKQEWRQYHGGGSTTPILIDARDISWLIEGGDRLSGKTIVGHRNGKVEAVVLNCPFPEFRAWWGDRIKRQTLDLVLLGTGRRMTVTKDGLTCVYESGGVTIVLPRSKGATPVPVDITYALLKAWFDTGPEPKRGGDDRRIR